MVYPARKQYDDLTKATEEAQAAQMASDVWRLRFGHYVWVMGNRIPENSDRGHLIRRENNFDKTSAPESNRSNSFIFNTLMLAPWYVKMLKNALGEDAFKALIFKLHSSSRRERLEAEKRLGMVPEPKNDKTKDSDSKDNDDDDIAVAALVPARQFGFATLFAGVAGMEGRMMNVFAPAALLAKNGWRNFSVAFAYTLKKAVDRMGLRRNLRTADLGASTHLAIATPHPAPNVLGI